MDEWGSTTDEWTLTGLDNGSGGPAWENQWNVDTGGKVWQNPGPFAVGPQMGIMAGMPAWPGEPSMYAQVPPYTGPSAMDKKNDPSMASPLNLPVPSCEPDDPSLTSLVLPDAEDEVVNLDKEYNNMPHDIMPNGIRPRVADDRTMVAQGIFASPLLLGDGCMCTRVEWQIDDFCTKLQATMNRHLVSPGFNVCGLNNLRLMLSANTREILKGANARGSRGRKGGALAAMSKLGPLHGSLKLKAEGAQDITFNLTVGKERQGPLANNFSAQVVHGVEDFGVDWLKEVDKNTGSLTVAIEFIAVGGGQRS
mmetsp:Transcript_19659/g.45822  ORF Transcript_19659/g.45822 Transcript_19659/m.45822 type:complete len:309 (-) Transcript_19659:270-1196(-)|eukprot:CAMPEP_0178390654 /NCGR_PEP_ID=MMETSP0689_2-20121128/10757_1 /TAXON_ID=160604 /ORGANISM="Amphidinium massartii, Strain CS-259" /LENGTH=308 /DNA_ID=CAMNT_0020011169 /DNA_START=54 /DNA_END=980 /DNA_ORIENTATION=-